MANVKVLRSASPLALVSLETIGAMTNTRPFTVGLLGASGRFSFAAATVREAEEYAIGMMAEDDSLFGGVVRCEGERRPVSRVLPG